MVTKMCIRDRYYVQQTAVVVGGELLASGPIFVCFIAPWAGGGSGAHLGNTQIEQAVAQLGAFAS